MLAKQVVAVKLNYFSGPVLVALLFFFMARLVIDFSESGLLRQTPVLNQKHSGSESSHVLCLLVTK